MHLQYFPFSYIFLEFFPSFGDHTVRFSGIIRTLQILTLFCLITSGTLSIYVNMGFTLPYCFFPIFKIYQPEITSYCSGKKKNLKSTIWQGLWQPLIATVFSSPPLRVKMDVFNFCIDSSYITVTWLVPTLLSDLREKLCLLIQTLFSV